MCCANALKSSLQLVSWASGVSEKVLERSYNRICQDKPTFFDVEADDGFEEEDEVDENLRKHVEADGDNECFNLLSDLQRGTVFLEKGDGKDEFEPETFEHLQEPAFPEQKLLDELCDSSKVADEQEDAEIHGKVVPESDVKLPCTLLQALNEKGDRWNALFRLCVKLRCAKGGMDHRYIGSGKNARRASARLNWFQLLGCRNNKIH